MRRAGIIVAVVLAIGLLVAGVALPTLASLRSMRDNVDKLTEQLTVLTKAQQDLVDKQAAAQAPVELRGKCYLKTEDQPAVGAEVEIWNADEMKLVRSMKTDAKGEFNSGPINHGSYFAMAPLVGKENPKVDWSVSGAKVGYFNQSYAAQSGLLYAYPGAASKPVLFDLYFSKGDIGFELDEPMPATLKVGDPAIEFGIYITAGARKEKLNFLPYRPTTLAEKQGLPLPGARGEPGSSLKLFGDLLSKREPLWIAGQFDRDRGINGPQRLLLAGKYECAAVLTAVPVETAKDPFASEHGIYNTRAKNLIEWSRGVPVRDTMTILQIDVSDRTLQTVRIKTIGSTELEKLATEQPNGFAVPLELAIGSSEPLRN